MRLAFSHVRFPCDGRARLARSLRRAPDRDIPLVGDDGYDDQ